MCEVIHMGTVVAISLRLTWLFNPASAWRNQRKGTFRKLEMFGKGWLDIGGKVEKHGVWSGVQIAKTACEQDESLTTGVA